MNNKENKKRSWTDLSKPTRGLNRRGFIFKTARAAGLARVANQYFTRENRVVLHYLPKSNN